MAGSIGNRILILLDSLFAVHDHNPPHGTKKENYISFLRTIKDDLNNQTSSID